MKQRRFGGHSLTSFTFHFGHAQLSRTRKDGSVETVQYASKTVGTAESNISKWAKGEDNIVEVAANKITGGLMKRNRSKPWFPRAESKLHKLFRAKRKRGLKVSTL